jgi:hypothetical protein
MANLLSQGTQLFISDLASPEVYAAVGQVVSISGPDGSAAEINVTNLDSSGVEIVPGIPDNGSVSLEVIYDQATATTKHATLYDARTSQVLQNLEIRLTDSPRTTLAFSAYVMQFSLSAGVDDKVGATFGIRVTGGVTITPAAS